MRSADPKAGPLSNAELSELLCLAAEQGGRSDQQRCALRRAGRAAFRWPIEACELVMLARPLTELRAVGPWLSRMIGGWIADPPSVPPPLAQRRGFLTRVECDRILESVCGRPVRGDLQVHTLGSDGSSSIREMATAAR